MPDGAAPRTAPPKASAAARLCGGCDFYQSTTITGSAGECRRRSPVVIVPHENEPETVWPRVAAGHWCGEFRGRA